MHNYLSLTKILFKTSLGSLIDGKTKKKNKMGMYALFMLLAMCAIPYLGLLYAFFNEAFKMFDMIDQAGSVIAIGFFLTSIMTFTFALFLIPSVFYFSKDIQNLLYLPLKPQTILASKFTVTLLYEYTFALFVMIPLFASYINIFGVNIIGILSMVISLILTPVVPLIYASLITMLLMRFVPFAKNRDLFNLVAGILGIVIGISLSFFIQSSMMQGLDALLMMLSDGSNSLIQLFSGIFPNLPFSATAIFNGSILDLIISIVIVIGFSILFLLFGKALYFKGVIGVNESKSKQKKMTQDSLKKSSKSKTILVAYVIKEIKLLFRTPIYFMNCILSSLIMPIILVVPFALQGDLADIDKIVGMINWDMDGLITYIIPIAFALGLFSSNINLISATAISREGSNYTFMKYIPVPYMTQINAKTFSGIIIGEFGLLLMLLPIAFIIKLPILFLLISFIIATLTLILGNYISIMCDVIRPKLVWEQEASAVKQNMTATIAMMICLVLSFSVIGCLFIADENMRYILSGVIVAVCIIMIPVIYKLLTNVVNKRLPLL